jgi:hypothetical protein
LQVTHDINLSAYSQNLRDSLIVTPLTSLSPIILTNIVDNEPVEIYYNALNPFIWSVTAQPEFQPFSVYTVSSGVTGSG